MYLPSLLGSGTQIASMLALPTHHQKPVLIDYAARGKAANTCAYVMGLNSVTDYWDTSSHLFNEPLREDSPAGAFWTPPWHLKPYRDYAIRVQGEALYNINENFVQGWDSADGFGYRNGATIFSGSLEGDRKSIRAQDLPAPDGARHRAQILRTYPDLMDATILKAYTLASSNAMNYIYVENQYFQLSDWSAMVKKVRGQYVQAMKDAGAKTSDIAPLHLFVVIPQPERDQMVPNTYDTIGELGHGQDMKTYNDKQVQGERAREQEAKDASAFATNSDGFFAPLPEAPANPQADLEALGVKALVAMLMTYDQGGEAKQILIKDRDSNAQKAEAARQAKANQAAKVHGGQADDVDVTNYSEYNIKPRSYREIYIHSKLMFVDDTFTTVGSANLNARSMVGDSEFNICTDDAGFTAAARKRAWGNLAGGDLDGGNGTRNETAKTFRDWQKRMDKNSKFRLKSLPPENNSFILQFEDSRSDPGYRLV